jgi:uncharacterized protein (UPF0332 family)
MDLAELLRKGLVRNTGPDKKLSHDLMLTAERDLKAAADNVKSGNHDWALAISYNAMLSAGRALMASMGYSPSAEAHHLAVVQFCASVLPPQAGPLAVAFNRYRVRRHDVIYGDAGSVGPEEAESAVKSATAFVDKMKERIRV